MKKSLLSLLLLSALLLLCCCGSIETAAVEKEIPSPSPSPADGDVGALVISEIMPKNRCTLRDSDGDFSDWIELENRSDKKLSLEGWSLSDGDEKGWELPAVTLAPGERILIFASGKDRDGAELHTDFKLSGGEELTILTPRNSVSSAVNCRELKADRALALQSDGSYAETLYPSPGFENSGEGYERWQAGLECESPLQINEVVVSNIVGNYSRTGPYDWVELKNVSGETVDLSEYWLSDDEDELKLWQLPKRRLSPGSTLIILCAPDAETEYERADFELGSDIERLYLSRGNELCDYVLLRDIPLKGSYGRMEGEGGFFFFSKPTFDAGNENGCRRISAPPVLLGEEGVFNGVDSVSVELSGSGSIYYTLDGSLPTVESSLYEGPIELSRTSVLRAVALEEGKLISAPMSASFIINENHSLPVASLSTDDPSAFLTIYNGEIKGREISGSLSLYEPDGSSFTIGCGIQMHGQNSLTLPKKSMKLEFRPVYGSDRLYYDLFDKPLQQYSSIVLHAGQDNHKIIFRQEIWQDLCLEMTDKVYTQYSKFAVLYINGEYFGLICIKEDISSDYYADHAAVSRESVSSVKFPAMVDEQFRNEVYYFCCHKDMSLPENYEQLCKVLDMEAFIDWVVLEGVCANQDLVRNVRFFRSQENGGKWEPVFFDLDHSMLDDFVMSFNLGKSMPHDYFAFSGVMGTSLLRSEAITPIMRHLIKNEQFRHDLICRFAEVYNTVLSNERVLERIDYYEALIAPEVERDWLRWGKRPEDWPIWVDHLRRVVTEQDWENTTKNALCYYLDMSEEEIARYFG